VGGVPNFRQSQGQLTRAIIPCCHRETKKWVLLGEIRQIASSAPHLKLVCAQLSVTCSSLLPVDEEWSTQAAGP
jgi:hypothetical protein